ncbi:MAG: hypothetical protein JSS87_09035 [Acidobacteria bacterium]|nr:hypothetical protein [Acidobacteriota bacterium]
MFNILVFSIAALLALGWILICIRLIAAFRRTRQSGFLWLGAAIVVWPSLRDLGTYLNTHIPAVQQASQRMAMRPTSTLDSVHTMVISDYVSALTSTVLFLIAVLLLTSKRSNSNVAL